jgi:pilus assembly protein CpaC
MIRLPLRALLLAALTLVAASAASAQSARGPSLYAPAVAPPANDAPAGRVFAVGIGKSQLVRLARPARDVLVASPGIADVVLRSPDTAFIVGRVAGETTVYFFDAQGRQIDALDVTVLFDTTALEEALKRALPNEEIDVSTVNTGIVLSGSVSSQQVVDDAVAIANQFVAVRVSGSTSNTASSGPTAASGGTTGATSSNTSTTSSQAVSIINLLKVRNQNQVLLRVRVSEMSRAVIKELGVSPGAVFNNFHVIGGSGALSTTTLTYPGFANGGVSITGATAPGVGLSFGGASAAFPANTTPFGGLAFAVPITAATGLTALIEALDENGLSKTLAEPNLTAVSGETASFLVGGSVPICQSTTTSNGIAQFSFIYKPFGIQLTFTPVVMSSNLISVRITAELSTLVTAVAGGAVAPTAGSCGAPAFTSRNVTTTVELPSGGSIALAGLLQNDDNSNIQGLPGLKDVPVLGALFSSKAYQENLDDLVITVTTVLARATSPGELAYPTDGFGPASDFNFYILNRMQTNFAPATSAVPPPQLKSTFGLILE